ncbi:hypothetical protein KIKIMORA_03670 [Brevundimonas phage vB_BpoS-Kikimora]|uniref:Uncharacterized protein n=1 Tax=Brevundimonas phage vB_BpoS-Kikimora TaxID=2948601 RepID=A0A9E7SKG6_9CAUD|nr:hypothetical protein KIKIMORA_03670 [Brevundimonas phage vB_BpoS-Kikimora]
MPHADNASAGTPPYHGYQVMVGGRLVQLQDICLEDACVALMQMIDVLEELESRADHLVSLVGRWRDGRSTAAGGLGSLP